MRAVSPHDLLLFVDTVREPEPEAVSVEAGPYTSYAQTGGSTLIPEPVGTYLAPGLHRIETGEDATAPLVLVLPKAGRSQTRVQAKASASPVTARRAGPLPSPPMQAVGAPAQGPTTASSSSSTAPTPSAPSPASRRSPR